MVISGSKHDTNCWLFEKKSGGSCKSLESPTSFTIRSILNNFDVLKRGESQLFKTFKIIKIVFVVFENCLIKDQ